MFRAYDAERERLVAVKLFKLDLPPERVHQLVDAFQQVIDVRLTHPAMAVPLATGITNVSAYLAQDYVAAESLDLTVREYGAAPPADALRVATQLAGALDFAAAVDVTHGSLHPRDVLLSSDETRLTGIGVGGALERIGAASPVRRPYAAPERVAGGAWDRRADVFSLAALIYELLWARRIGGPGSQATDGITDLPGGGRAGLLEVFARALSENPGDRFATALEFTEALKRAFPGVSVSEPGVPSKRRGTSSAARKMVGPLLPLGEQDEQELHEAEVREEKVHEAELLGEDPSGQPPPQPASSALDLYAEESRSREESPFQDVEATLAPAAPEVTMSGDGTTRGDRTTPLERATPIERATVIDPVLEPPPISVLEQSRSAVWPLMAALVIGLALGFAGGYGVGSRERAALMTSTIGAGPATPAPAATTGAETPSVAQLPASLPSRGREATEVAVPPAPTSPPARKSLPQQRAADASVGAARTPPSRIVRPVERPPAPSGTAGPLVGRLSVESRPAGARVFLDDKLIGTTPLGVASVSAGEHAIRLELEGYHGWASTIRITVNDQNRVTASLDR